MKGWLTIGKFALYSAKTLVSPVESLEEVVILLNLSLSGK